MPESEAIATESKKAIEIKSSMAVGYLMKQLLESGVTDFDSIAEKIHELKVLQNKEKLWSYDRFTESGSATSAKVITESDGESRDCVLWCINHYLGLNRNPRVIAKAKAALEKFGTGCGTSPISGGMNSLHREIESRIAAMLSKEECLLFPTGYTANLGALSSLPGKNDIILFDHQSHASIIDGCKLSRREWMAFTHNDVQNLESKLKRFSGKYENIFVVVEAAYSMSGDLAPLREIVELKKKYKFYLYVDEAHSFGFYGDKGRGYCQEMGVLDDVDFIMSTLSKATASIGGFVAGKRKHCSLMQVTAGAYIFQACFSPTDAATILACLDEVQEDESHKRVLHEKNAYMRGKLLAKGFDLRKSQSPIIPIYIPELDKLYAMGKKLYENGVFSVSVIYPAVKLNEGRLRFIVNSSHTYGQIDYTVAMLEKFGKEFEIIL